MAGINGETSTGEECSERNNLFTEGVTGDTIETADKDRTTSAGSKRCCWNSLLYSTTSPLIFRDPQVGCAEDEERRIGKERAAKVPLSRGTIHGCDKICT